MKAVHEMSKRKIIVIVGPTSSGKSALAVELARRCGGEVISADSRQVYRGLDIGTGKITRREMKGIPHHLLSVVSPEKIFSAHDFLVRARRSIAEIADRGKVPIICGGTGFYIDALLGRSTLPDVPPNANMRAKLEKKSVVELFGLLKRRDPRRAKTIDPHNKRRIVRALEIIWSVAAVPQERTLTIHRKVLWIGLIPGRDALRRRINARLSARLKSGMVAEAKRLHARGLSYKRMRELGLEYRSLARFLQKKISRKELEIELQHAIWRYAKRQMTYWRRNKNIHWFEPRSVALYKLVQRYLNV